MIIFADIDDTLMKTARKIPDIRGLQVGAVNNQGEPISYIDHKRWQLIEELISKQVCIPVTARSKSTFNNLNLKFNHHAVINFGATVLNKDKQIDMQWFDYILEESNKLKQHEVFDHIEKQSEFSEIFEGFEIKLKKEDGMSLYLNCRNIEKDTNKVENLKIQLIDVLKQLNLEDKFYFYQTDRDVVMLPTFIKKEEGVEYVLENFYDRNELLVGIGDNKNDLSFMQVCDFIMVPTDSSLMKLIQKKL